MRLKRDSDALESLPLKLMIVVVVASMSIIPAGQALENFRDRDFVTRAQLELESIISSAKMLMIDGPGGVRTLSLDFEFSGRFAFQSLELGDRKGGPNMSAAVLHLASGACIVRTASEPEVWMRSQSGDSFIVSDPRFSIRLSIQLSDRLAFVLVEMI